MDRTRIVLRNLFSQTQRRRKRFVCHRTFVASVSHSSSTADGRAPSPSPNTDDISDALSAAEAPVRHTLAPPPDPWRQDTCISPGEANLIVGGQPFSFKCGHVARFADGAAVCQIGHTAVLVTAVSAKPDPGKRFSSTASLAVLIDKKLGLKKS